MLDLCKKIACLAIVTSFTVLPAAAACAASPEGFAKSEAQWHMMRQKQPAAQIAVEPDKSKPVSSAQNNKANKPAKKEAARVKSAPGKGGIAQNVQPKAKVKNVKPAASKRSLKQPPASRQYMRRPVPADFNVTVSKDGGYTLAMPKYSDPLAGLDNLSDIMLVRTLGNNLAAAATVIDSSDALHYKATQSLPTFADKKVLWKWEHTSSLEWQCALSRVEDYYGDKMVLEASAPQGGKIYQLLYVFPANEAADYLPMALYSLHSFRVTAMAQK